MRSPKIVDLTGRKFCELTVLRLSEEKTAAGKARWECLCDCGTRAVVTGGSLTSGMTKSCGCRKHRAAHNRTHNMTSHPMYSSWCSMKTRCLNPKDKEFHNYGARGVKIHPTWINSFTAFMLDMGPTWEAGLTLDRIETDGHYEPGNCRWATWVEQAQNKRSSIIYEKDGERLCESELARRLGLPQGTLWARRKQGFAPIGWSLVHFN